MEEVAVMPLTSLNSLCICRNQLCLQTLCIDREHLMFKQVLMG